MSIRPRCPRCRRSFVPLPNDPHAGYCSSSCLYDAPPGPSDPSPQEIAARCQAIRAGWGAAELLARCRADWLPSSWAVPSASPDLRGFGGMDLEG